MRDILARTFKILGPFSGCMHDNQDANILTGYLIDENVWKLIHYYLVRTRNTTRLTNSGNDPNCLQ